MTAGVIRRVGRWFNDQLVAPGASSAELVVSYLTALVGAAFAVWLAVMSRFDPVAVVVLGLVAFDLFGGAVVNATAAAKRLFHGPGRSAGKRMLFVAGHIHVFLVALVVPGYSWLAAGLTYAMAVAGGLVVVAAPDDVRRPIAFSVTVLTIAICLTSVTMPVALLWLTPVLAIKLLLGHLLPGRQS